MNIRIKYSGQPIDSFIALPLCYNEDEFESPARSTIPSIAYWSTPVSRITELSTALHMPAPIECTMDFEHKVPPPKGRGKESHTDLMISWNEVCVGVEAKYTEPHYDTVAHWIAKGKDKENRRAVLEGWLDLTMRRTGQMVHKSAISNLTYQMVHRFASVCARPELNAIMFYQVFNPDNEKKEYYRTELHKLINAIDHTRTVRILLSWVSFMPLTNYHDLTTVPTFNR